MSDGDQRPAKGFRGFTTPEVTKKGSTFFRATSFELFAVSIHDVLPSTDLSLCGDVCPKSYHSLAAADSSYAPPLCSGHRSLRRHTGQLLHARQTNGKQKIGERLVTRKTAAMPTPPLCGREIY